MPPAPSVPVISYGPSFVPAVKVICGDILSRRIRSRSIALERWTRATMIGCHQTSTALNRRSLLRSPNGDRSSRSRRVMTRRTPLPRFILTGIFISALASAAPARGQASNDSADAAAQHQHMHSGGEELFEARDGSGTSWLPDDTPMFGAERQWGGWTV